VLLHFYAALDFPLKPNPLLIWGAPGIGKTSIVSKVLDARKQEGRLIYLDIQYTTPESWFMPYLQKDEKEEGGVKYVDKPRGILPLYHPSGNFLLEE
jgi:MoxR-like ATPase